MEPEIWKTIFGYEDYEISSHGRIRSYKRVRREAGGSLLVPVINNGYCCVKLSRKINGRSAVKTFKMHRLVAFYFIRPPILNEEVNHKDFNRSNNCVENLEWIFPKDHRKHKFENGRCPFGENAGMAKLTNKNVIMIVSLRHIFTDVELAAMFNVSKGIIGNLLRGICYSKVTNIRREQNSVSRNNRSSKYRGVYKKKRKGEWNGKFIAQIYKKKTYYFGTFYTEEAAALAYDKKCYEMFGDKELLNFPERI